MWAPEVPLEPSPTVWDMDSWHLLPQLMPGTHDITAHSHTDTQTHECIHLTIMRDTAIATQ